jgi:hypothetical protein
MTAAAPEPTGDHPDRARVQLAMHAIRAAAAPGEAIDRTRAHELLSTWDQGDELSAAEIAAVLDRFGE